MSHENALKQAKKGKFGKKGSKAAAAAPPAEEDLSAEYWSNITTNDVAAVKRGKGEDARIEVIRRTKGADGKYLKPSKDSGQAFKNQTATFRASPKSTLNGAGNAGLMCGENKAHHGNAKYSLGLALGNLQDGVEREGLEEEQKKCMEWMYGMGRKLMTDTFHLNMSSWKGPLDRAYNDARKLLWNHKDVKNSEGASLKDWTELEEVEQSDEKVAELVREKACECFVANARPLPGAPKKDENGNEMKPVAYASLKTWFYPKFNNKTDRRNNDTGPSTETVPINLANWAFIVREMARLRREHKRVRYATANGSGQAVALPPADATLQSEQVNAQTGKREIVTSTFPDPFWNPLFDKDGKPTESLVSLNVMWTVYRGDPSSIDKYGVRLSIASPITIACRAYRRAQVVTVKAGWATGWEIQNDDADDEDDDAEEIEEGEVKSKPAETVDNGGVDVPPPSAAGKAQPVQQDDDEDDDDDDDNDDAESESEKTKREREVAALALVQKTKAAAKKRAADDDEVVETKRSSKKSRSKKAPVIEDASDDDDGVE